nr:hypothetical protein CFP56_66670 [Quercus suber]
MLALRRKGPDNSSRRRGTRGGGVMAHDTTTTKTGCALMSRLRHGARKFGFDLPRGGYSRSVWEAGDEIVKKVIAPKRLSLGTKRSYLINTATRAT